MKRNSVMVFSCALLSALLFAFSPMAYAETISVNFEGNDVEIEYTAVGMTVNGVDTDLDFISLIFDVDVTDSIGVFEITLDRNFFDAVYQGSDDEFIVIADGEEPSFEEITTNSQSRTLRIELPVGTDDVEIIGTDFGDLSEISVPVEDTTAEDAAEKEAAEQAAAKAAAEKEAAAAAEETKPKIECGTGTVLKDGVCVLDETCGPGTVLQDGVCVLVPAPESTPTKLPGGSDLGFGMIAAFVIAGAIIIVLALMSKASKQRD